MSKVKDGSQWLKMKALPYNEYYLARALMQKYDMHGSDQYTVKGDWSELFTIALRVMYEVLQYNNGQGEQWIINVINEYRSNKSKVIPFELEGKLVKGVKSPI